MYTSEPEKIPDIFTLVHPVLDIKDVCCAAGPPGEKSTLMKSLKAPHYHNIDAHDECM